MSIYTAAWGVIAAAPIGDDLLAPVQETTPPGTARVGQATVVGIAVFSITGTGATTQVGAVIVAAGTGTSIFPEGASAFGFAASPEISGDSNTTVGGVFSTPQVGGAFGAAGAGATVSGVSITGRVGTISMIGTANVFPVGAPAFGRVTPPIVWGPVIPPELSAWSGVVPAGSSAWTPVNTDAINSWNSVEP